MSVVKLYKTIENNSPKNMEQLSNAQTIDEMMGFSPIETVVNDVIGSKDKLFRVGKLI